MITERNAPCPCGSGRKYKKCCLAKDEAEVAMRKAEAKRQAEAAAEEERRAREKRQAEREPARSPAPTETDDDSFANDGGIEATREAGWPALSAEDQQVVDAWWAEVSPVYQGRGGLEQSEWLLGRTVAFLDEHPHLFRYLRLYDEFLLEVGSALDRAGHMTEHHALLVRLRNEQPEVYAKCFGYWDFDLLAEALRAGRQEDIPACLTRFRNQPIRFIDEFAKVVDLLAWHGCETELRGLLEPTAAMIADSPEVIQGDFGLRWLATLAMIPVLEMGDTSPESLERLCDQVMAVAYLSDEPDNREWLRRAARMALPTEAEAALDLNQAHSTQFAGDVAWSFAGWLHRTKGCRWTSARFLAEHMLNYWDWAEDPAKGRKKAAKKAEKRAAKKGPKDQAAAAFGLDGNSLRRFLNDYCVAFFDVRTLAALSTLQAFHYFTEYLVAGDQLNSERASKLQRFPARDFALVLKGVGGHDPVFRIYPTYEALISGPMSPGKR